MIQIHCIKGGIWQEKFKCITQTTFYHILLQPYKFVMSAKQVMWFTFQIRQLFWNKQMHTHTHTCLCSCPNVSRGIFSIYKYTHSKIYTHAYKYTLQLYAVRKNTLICRICVTPTRARHFKEHLLFTGNYSDDLCDGRQFDVIWAIVINLMSYVRPSSIWCDQQWFKSKLLISTTKW